MKDALLVSTGIHRVTIAPCGFHLMLELNMTVSAAGGTKPLSWFLNAAAWVTLGVLVKTFTRGVL